MLTDDHRDGAAPPPCPETGRLQSSLKLADRYLLHPNYIVRVCGEPARLLELTRTGKTASAVREKEALESGISDRSGHACSILEAKIPGLADRRLSRAVLKLKRDIFNRRGAGTRLVEQIGALLTAEENEYIRQINDDISKYRQMDADIVAAYDRDIESTRVQLRRLWQRRNLKLGVSYSNPKLYSELNRYFDGTGAGIKAKKRRQLEEALVRYASRCAVKVSPLSTFTSAFVGDWQPAPGCSGISLSFGEAATHVTEYKSGLMHCIMNAFLSRYDEVKQRFPLRINPSLAVEGDMLSFRKVTAGESLNGRVWGAGESETRLKANKVLQLILYAFGRSTGKTAWLPEVIQLVQSHAPKLTAGQVDDFIRRLFEIELVQPATEIYAQIDSLDWVDQLFEGDTDDTANAVRPLITELRSRLATYGAACANERVAIDGAVRQATKRLIEHLGAEPPEALTKTQFFENCYLTSIRRECSISMLKPFADELALLTDMSALLDFQHHSQTDLADFFLVRFGHDGVCTDPAGLLAEFDRIYGISQLGPVGDPDGVVPRSEVRNGHASVVAEFAGYLLGRLQSNEAEAALDRSFVRSLLEKLPEPIRRRQVSHSFIGQFATGDGDCKFVVNQVFPGHSGLLSRFLEVLKDDGVERIRSYLRTVSREGSYAEVPGVFGFNANRHPRMSNQEIVFPPFPNNWQETEKLHLSKLEMVFDPDTHRAYLRRPGGPLLETFYHGFLIPFLIPSQQRLFAFLGMNGTMVYILQAVRSGRLIRPKQITPLPRICLGNAVLIRRSWLVPRDLLPSTSLSASGFFCAIQAWAREQGFPPDCFIRVAPFEQTGGGDLDWANMDFKNMKPFYVRLDNVRMVQILQRALNRNDYPIVLSETLPAVTDQHVRINGEDRVAEIQFELTRLAQANA